MIEPPSAPREPQLKLNRQARQEKPAMAESQLTNGESPETRNE
jgi:hypothetical protein